ncbi:MAG: anion permease, partial [Candidatus Bathyarchaeia archaeon]
MAGRRLLELIIAIIAVALLFDFYNGMNDAANSIATVVSTRVLRPLFAVAWAALFNFAAIFVYGVSVATTIGKGIVQPGIVDSTVILTGVVAAVFWLAIATRRGIPLSASHCLIGGFVGAGLAAGGIQAIVTTGFITVIVFMFVAPLLGLALGFVVMSSLYHVSKKMNPRRMDPLFGRLQLVSAAFYSLGHGGNDAQKTAGIITILLFATGYLGGEFFVPLWVLSLSYATIAVGTLTGGWRVIKTMGMRLTRLRPVNGFAAETTGGLTLAMTALAGIPASTTHVITGSIMGVGSVRR